MRLVLLAAGLLACTPPTTASDEERPSSARTVSPDLLTPQVQCRASSSDKAHTSFAGVRCEWELLAPDGAVVLHSLDPEVEGALKGELPEPCRRRGCELEGIDTVLGPMVLAVERSEHSEMPASVWLGVAAKPKRLVFVDLWAGAGVDVMGDGTPLGPSHTLAPFICDGSLALLAVPRLNAATSGVTPPSQLRRREGIYTMDTTKTGNLGYSGAVAPAASCMPVALTQP